MGRLVYRSGGVAVAYSDVLDRVARAAIERAAPGVLQAMERELGEVHEAARRDWPVRTGRSRDGLVLDSALDPTTGRLRVSIRNDVPYAIYIKPKKLYGATTAWERYVRKPGRVKVRELARELGPVLLAVLRKGGTVGK